MRDMLCLINGKTVPLDEAGKIEVDQLFWALLRLRREYGKKFVTDLVNASLERIETITG